MESHFIRERAVTRENIIKKNARAQNVDSKHKKNSQNDRLLDQPSERVAILEETINEGLKQDLVDLSRRVGTICETIADYIKVRSALKVLKTNPRDVRMLTNIGCNFYAQCQVDDASKIYLCIGKNYFLHMDLEEAIKMIDLKERQYMQVLDKLQDKAASIKAYIKIALEAMGKIYELNGDSVS